MYNKPIHISFLKDARVYGFHYGPIMEYVKIYPLLNQTVCFDFYSMIFFENKEGSVTINDRIISPRYGLAFLIPPFTDFSVQSNENTKGYFIFFCKDFYAVDFNSIHLLYLFSFFNKLRKDKIVYYLDLSDGEQNITPVLGLMAGEYLGKENVNSAVIRSYLNIVIQKMILLVNKGREKNADDSLIILDKLSALIETHHREQRTLGFYARQTGVPENRLNEICTMLFHTRLKQLIIERVMMEARKMLEQTNLTVSEIAYNLHFTDNSNFNKLFKIYTKITPKHYREMHKRLLP